MFTLLDSRITLLQVTVRCPYYEPRSCYSSLIAWIFSCLPLMFLLLLYNNVPLYASCYIYGAIDVRLHADYERRVILWKHS